MFVFLKATPRNCLFHLNSLKSYLFSPNYLCRTMSAINKIAVCQFTATNDKKKNFDTVEKFVKYAFTQRAKMVFLPEASDYMATGDLELKHLAEPLDGHLMEQYRKLACDHNIWLSIGGFHEECNGLFYNSHVIINDKGEFASVYRKLHLFDVSVPEKSINLMESKVVVAGSKIVPPIETPIGKIGLMICYDLRFPELSTILRKMGADILTYPSAFTVPTGEAHWETLLRSRAIENQCYVIAAAQYGCHNEKRKSFGQSLVIDPWGKITGEGPKYSENSPTNESVILVVVDKDVPKNVQRNMPVFNHRRNDLYQLIASQSLIGNLSQDYMFSNKLIPRSTVFYSTPYCYAFTNIRCVVPGHVLVASTRSVERLQDLSAVEVSDFFQTAIKVQKLVEKVYEAKSSTICVQDGPEAGQTIAHVHCHILPRRAGDFVPNDDIYLKLATHDKAGSDPLRSLEEMTAEATLLRHNL